MAAQSLPRPIIIGITGNIGSGKSSFCAFLEQAGLAVYYADLLAKAVLRDPEVLSKLAARWGNEIAEDGKPRSEVIAAKVFGKPEELAFLNSLVHPGTLKQMQQLVEQSTTPVVLFEVPLLFEARLEDCFDYLVLITAPLELRTRRIIDRDKATRQQVGQRAAAQLPDSEKASRCDLVILNDKGLKDLEEQALIFVRQLPELRTRPKRPFYSGN